MVRIFLSDKRGTGTELPQTGINQLLNTDIAVCDEIADAVLGGHTDLARIQNHPSGLLGNGDDLV